MLLNLFFFPPLMKEAQADSSPGVFTIAAGNAHSLAIKADGTVVGWGDSYAGKTIAPAGLSDVVAVAAGWDHSLALKSDGTVVAWGSNNYDQSKVPTELDFTKPAISFATDGNASPAKTAQSKVTVTDFGSGVDGSSLAYVWTQSMSEPTDGWQPFSNGQQLTLDDQKANGEWYLHVRALDKAGNVSYARTNAFVLDNAGPVIIFGTNGNATPSKMAASTVTVTDEGSGVDEDTLEYAWSDSPGEPVSGWQSFGNGQMLTLNDPTANGDWYLHVRAKDQAGNQSYARTNVFVLDNTDPVISFGMNGNATPSKNAASTVSVTDEGSGVDTLEYVWTQSPGEPDSGWQSFGNGQTLTLNDPTANGDWYLHVRAKDQAGNQSYARTNAFVLDNAGPVITFGTNGNATPSKNAASTVSVTDDNSGVDGSTLEYVWTQSPGEPASGWQSFGNGSELKLDVPNANGNWYLHVRGKDKLGHESYAVSGAFVLDNMPPEITLNGENPITVEQGGTFVDPGATATDNIDGDLTTSIVVSGTVDTQAAGTYMLNNNVTDTAGNQALTVTRTVYVLTAEPPFIQFVPNGNSKPARTVQSKVTVTDEGSGVDESTLAYVWADSLSEPASGWQSFSNGQELTLDDPSANGNWYLHIRANDKLGNPSHMVSNAFLLDNRPPIISLIGSNPLYVPHETVFVEPGAMVTDNIDGDLTESIQITGSVDTQTMGLYTRYYSVTDRAGNSATVTRSVYVYDGSDPVIYLQGANPMYVEAGSSFVDPGATAMDRQDGDLTHAIVVTGTVDPMTIGTYLLTYNVSDSADNQAPTVTRTVYVQDTLPPVLVLLGEIEMTLPYGTTFQDPGAQAMDAYYGDLSHLIEVNGSVNTKQAGTYILRYYVQDPSGNSAEVIRMVHVQKKPSSSSPGDGSSGSDSDESGSGGSDGGATRVPQDNNANQVTTSGLFIDANGSLINAMEIDTSQSLVIIEVSLKETDTADETETVYVSVPVSLLTDMADENPNLQMEIKAPYASYLLPATLPSLLSGWDELLEENHWQADQISFKLTMTDLTGDPAIQRALAEQLPGGQLIGRIVAFDLALVDTATGEVLTEINQFTQPLMRMIPLPKEIDPNFTLWGAFRYEPTSGEFSFVPARLEERDGEWFAVLLSYSNSIYLVLENKVSFVDTKEHWGRAAVAQAAAKGLVRGRGDGLFAPDSPVSRAEFSAMLVTAMGRSNISSNPSILPYVDVQSGAWYISEVAQAQQLGLLDFIQDNRLMANQPLTREEMASMLAEVIRLEMHALPEQLFNLDGYKDRADMDEAYLEDIQLMVTLGIMTGMGADQFSPKGETTRAQAAVVLLRTLGTLGWID